MLADTSYGSDDNVQHAATLGVELVSPVSGPTTTPEPDAQGCDPLPRRICRDRKH
jgi:hypothetical protein